MRAYIHLSHKLIEIYDTTELEIKQLNSSFTKQNPNVKFIKHLKGKWDGKVSFFFKDKYLPLGLWKELWDVCQLYNFPIVFDNLKDITDSELDKDQFNEWLDSKFEYSKIKPYSYQREAAYKILKNRHCLGELATGAGKTFILYIIYLWLFENIKTNKKFLIVVPTVDLVLQTVDSFQNEYRDNVKSTFKVRPLYGDAKKIDDADVIVATWQTLNLIKDPTFWDLFYGVCIDEVHGAKAYSIKKILENLYKCDYRFGLSGTIPKDPLDRYQILANTGPVIINVSTSYLQKNEYAAKCFIEVHELKYASDEVLKKLENLHSAIKLKKSNLTGVDLLNIEIKLASDSEEKINYIIKQISRFEKNQLVLFRDIKGKFGKKMQELTKKLTNKECFYIDGEINSAIRTKIIDQMKTGENKVLFASFGTFSTGINIKNIHILHLTESYKSDTIIRQSIGRGLRLHEHKDKLIILDYVDDFSTNKYKGYLKRHSNERKTTFNEQGFEFQVIKNK
jgi:superfamily II DNA or RNA helicase